MYSFLTHIGYLDPGTGSIIIQAIIGVIAGIAVFGRKMMSNITHKVRSRFGRKDNKKEDE